MKEQDIIKEVESYINGKYNLGIIDDKIVKDCINKTLETINYTRCCESDSELLLCGVCDEETKHDVTLREELHCLKCGNVAKE